MKCADVWATDAVGLAPALSLCQFLSKRIFIYSPIIYTQRCVVPVCNRFITTFSCCFRRS